MFKRKKMRVDDQAAYLLSGVGLYEYIFPNTGWRVVVNAVKGIGADKVTNTLNHSINTLGYMSQSPAGSVAGDCFRSVFKEQKQSTWLFSRKLRGLPVRISGITVYYSGKDSPVRIN
jgi:hypothetical protein